MTEGIVVMDELMLKVEHVSKEYRLGVIGSGTLKGEIQSKIAHIRHREDPNLKIGEKNHEKNERFLALDDINLEVKKGERIGIIGHNGAGKSTLLKLICRVTAPSKGNIFMDGRITSMLEVGTGFHGELTGRENVYLNGAILGMSKGEIDKKFDKIVEFSEIGQFIDTPVKRYSSGMRVKLGFSVASHLDSEIMIMDEVLAVGDMAFQKKCIERMHEVAKDEGRTILYVSHNMSTIRQLCDRCVVLEHGKIVFNGDVEEAIKIYMPKTNESDYRKIWKFSDVLRPVHLEKRICSFENFEFLNSNCYELTQGEVLSFLLEISSETATDKVCFRSIVYTDDDIPVCLASTESGDMNINNGINTFRCKINTSLLAPGEYKLKFVLYEVDGYGHETIYDVIDKLVRFSISDERLINGLEWQRAWWGNIKLDNITAENFK